MTEQIHESVSVVSMYHALGSTYPLYMQWRGRKYQFISCGLHHTTHNGDVLLHVFTVNTNAGSFQLVFNTKTLSWILEAIETI